MINVQQSNNLGLKTSSSKQGNFTDCISVIKNRRSVRKFTDKPIPIKIIKEIIECGKYAPSACDSQPWEFFVLTDKNKINDILSDRFQMKNFPYYINSKKYAQKNGLENYNKVETPPVVIALVGDKNLSSGISSLVTSLSCCALNMLIAAEAFGIGACWLYVYDPDESPETESVVRSKLLLDDNFLVFCLIILGYPNQKVGEKLLRKVNVRFL